MARIISCACASSIDTQHTHTLILLIVLSSLLCINDVVCIVFVSLISDAAIFMSLFV